MRGRAIQEEETANIKAGRRHRALGWNGKHAGWAGAGDRRGAVLGSVVTKEGPLDDHAHGTVILGSLH